MFGYYRIAAAVPAVTVADPLANAHEIVRLLHEAKRHGAAVTIFPELTLTSYSAADLFNHTTLLEKQDEALEYILENMKEDGSVAVLGYALRYGGKLYNTALIIQAGRILGCVPKSYIPNKREFYEKRWFVSGRDIREAACTIVRQNVPFGVDLLFSDGGVLTMGIELCEDLWAVTPPSLALAEAGATLLCNLSASNELVGKHAYRQELVRTQSARCIAAYAYASAGVGESTTDTVFGGEALIADYGALAARNERFRRDSHLIFADIDFERFEALRRSETAFCDAPAHTMRTVTLAPLQACEKPDIRVAPHPFVPASDADRDARCEEIVAIQAHGLLTRMQRAGIKRAVLGISGGLDSTLALLSTVRAFELAKTNKRDIIAVTMPGFGTTTRTKSNAERLCEALGVTLKTIDITPLARAQFQAIEHDETIHDVTYENVQARARTSVLMNTANKHHALVVGTGDLSEIALGWSTYNGDHMSMYAINAGVPKTLVRYVIAYFARQRPELADVLHDILDTPVSPELLPHENDTIVQQTEAIVGPYELHDFFLYHFVKYGFSPEKIAFLALSAFKERYDEATIDRWLKVFIRRFFTQQFKRSCMPDGPKVGTIALSPRADWRMASDASFQAWLSMSE
jgi:NAD+ synthase (glutamine-hydrolysing)